MSADEVDLLKESLSQATNYLEYGTGCSTKAALEFSHLVIVSVESHLEYSLTCKAEMVHDKLDIVYVDIGTTGRWGFPSDESRKQFWPEYTLCPYNRGYKPDLILIDGRFRVACGVAAALKAPEAIVLIHDYTNRPYYHVLEQFFTIEKTARTMVKLKRRISINEQLADFVLQKELYVP